MSALRILLASVLLAACLTEVPKPPSPQFGQLCPLFLDVKNNVLRECF